MDNQRLMKAFEGRSAVFLGGLAMIGVLLVLAIWWVLRPSYVPLYKEATEASQADILATLSQWQVPYRINAKEGVIEVPEEKIGAARIHLAEAGIPTRAGVGFELFDKADYGMSEFSQKINYQRALEGELARSVMSINEVKFARVHLTLKKPGLYQNSEEQAKASVIVRLKPNAELNSKQVQGIQQLVASAVEGMTLEHVVVLDEEGRALSAGDGVAAMPERMQLASRIEAELQQKAAQLLQRSFGSHGAQVSVRVLMNFDRIKSVREQPIVSEVSPAILREKQLSSSTGNTGESEGKRSQSTREVDYVVGKERSEVEHAIGSIERVSVGVVLAVAQSESVMQEVQHLLEAALGLDTKRGDQLVIAYMPPNLAGNDFAASMTAPVVSGSEMPLPESTRQPWLLWGLGLLTIVLFVSLLVTWMRPERRNPARTHVALMAPAEREQLLVDLQRWLQEGR